MKQYLLPSLIANAASMGYHWIYDAEYLQHKASQGSLLFCKPNIKDYQAAKVAYFAYPQAEVGDVSVQGTMMIWLYQALKDNQQFSFEAYQTLLYERFKPGGPYQGYVESYAQRLVAHRMLPLEKGEQTYPLQQDDHLVGFVPYLVTKELGLGTDKAWMFAQLFTQDTHYLTYYQMFEVYFHLVSAKTHKKALLEALNQVPTAHRNLFDAAITMQDTAAFVQLYQLKACAYKQALPIIVHLAYHATSLVSTLEANMRIGGNLCDRATYLAALLAPVFPLPEAWASKVDLETKIKGAKC